MRFTFYQRLAATCLEYLYELYEFHLMLFFQIADLMGANSDKLKALIAEHK